MNLKYKSSTLISFFVFFLSISVFTVAIRFMWEKMIFTDKIEASFVFDEKGNLALNWEKKYYPIKYEVKTFLEIRGINKDEKIYKEVKTQDATDNFCVLETPPITTYYSLTARGIWGASMSTGLLKSPLFPDKMHPTPISRYNEKNPAPKMPYLLWHVVPGAVCYELEILSDKPEKEGGEDLAKKGHLFSTRHIFTNGYQADLSSYVFKKIYWRVRALGLHHESIGEFSAAEELIVDPSLPDPDYPLINNIDRMPNFSQPIYPVFSWIPLHNVTKYETELMINPPKEEMGQDISSERAWHQASNDLIACYDEYARPYAGAYYWRVRGLNDKGETIGRFSKTERFDVPEREERVFLVAFGDSITHGGGNLSYPPSSLEYDYTTYLDFPALNLGRSGDTSHTSLERIEKDVLPLKPLNLLIMTGSNSLRSTAVSAEDVIEDMKRMEEICLANDIRPIFLTLMPINPTNIQYAFHTSTDPKWRKKMQTINAYLRRSAYCIDLEPYFYDKTRQILDPDLSVDGLHPDIEGKMLMAAIINQHKALIRQKQ